MADEQKPIQKPSLEAPKDIEDLLKDLPKISDPKPSPLMPFKPSPALPSTPKPPSPFSSPLQPTPPSSKFSAPPATQPSPPPLKAPADIKTIIPAPSSLSTGQDKFKSLIRTMGEDLESAKKGMKPESKSFEIKPPPISPKPMTPPPLKAPLTPSETRLGQGNRTRSLEMQKPAAPFTDISRPKKSSPILKIIILILGISVVFAGIWYFMIREEKIAVIPTFTPTATPTLTSKTLSEIIPSSSQITISSAENFSTALNNKIKSLTPIKDKFLILEVFDENGDKYTLSDFIAKLNVSIPGLLDSLDPSDAALLLYGQKEMFNDKGLLNFSPTPKAKISLIAKSISSSSTRSALNTWEITMTDELKNLFVLDPQKASAQTFLDNTYNGVDIRYRNFSYADNSIDYTIINLSEFNSNYLILTNSRESIYSAIDLLRNQ